MERIDKNNTCFVREDAQEEDAEFARQKLNLCKIYRKDFASAVDDIEYKMGDINRNLRTMQELDPGLCVLVLNEVRNSYSHFLRLMREGNDSRMQLANAIAHMERARTIAREKLLEELIDEVSNRVYRYSRNYSYSRDSDGGLLLDARQGLLTAYDFKRNEILKDDVGGRYYEVINELSSTLDRLRCLEPCIRLQEHRLRRSRMIWVFVLTLLSLLSMVSTIWIAGFLRLGRF